MDSSSAGSAGSKRASSVMFWTSNHDIVLCREVVNLNPYSRKKGSTQRTQVWEKIAETLNACKFPVFNVDKRSVRDHDGILQNRHKKKLRAEEKATGITPDEPSELDNLIEQIIALEESSDAELQEMSDEKKAKLDEDRAKAEDMRMQAMEKISETKKREADDEVSKSKRRCRSSSDALEYLSERAELQRELKERELTLKQEKQVMEEQQFKAILKQQDQQQQQQTAMIKLLQEQQQQNQQQQLMVLQQQQQQMSALMTIVNKHMNK